MADNYIPKDIIMNILLRVPASSLQRLKLVSKAWFQMISNQNFAEEHLTRQSKQKFSWGVFLNITMGLFFVRGTTTSEPSPPQPTNLPGALGKIPYAIGSCKGIVLFSTSGKSFKLHVANPITGESRTLPPFYRYNDERKSSLKSASIGYGRDQGEIKVVVIVKQYQNTPATPFICGILALGSSVWREMLTPIVGHQLKEPYVQPVFARGALHWCCDTSILSLDLAQEKFCQTEVTFCSSNALRKHASYVEWDGYYGVIFFSYHSSPFYTLWTLRESGWHKQPEIDSSFFERLGYSAGHDRPYLWETMRNGEILLFLQGIGEEIRMLVYDLRSHAMTKFTQFDSKSVLKYKRVGRHCLVSHVNSMLSCSSPTPPERIRICGRDSTMYNIISRTLAYPGRTIRNLLCNGCNQSKT